MPKKRGRKRREQSTLEGLGRPEALLQQVNLYPDRKRAVATYSGGMRQRFGIAQALLGDPRLIIVDEPTAGLDPEERNRFLNLLLRQPTLKKTAAHRLLFLFSQPWFRRSHVLPV